jgi:hypothetical protein
MNESTEWVKTTDHRCSRDGCERMFYSWEGFSSYSSVRKATVPGQFCSAECAERSRSEFEADDLGDTPEHLRPLLQEARRVVPGAVISEWAEPYDDDGTMWRVLWTLGAEHRGWCVGSDGLLHGFASDDQRRFGSCPRTALRDAIASGRCYPTADARRIGREEFGMVFDGYAPPIARDAMQCPACSAAAKCERHAEPALETEKNAAPAHACPCGATTNLRAVSVRSRSNDGSFRQDHRCGACEQERRRTELLADMDRMLPPKKPEKSLAPASWPEDAGDNYEL